MNKGYLNRKHNAQDEKSDKHVQHSRPTASRKKEKKKRERKRKEKTKKKKDCPGYFEKEKEKKTKKRDVKKDCPGYFFWSFFICVCSGVSVFGARVYVLYLCPCVVCAEYVTRTRKAG